MAELVTLANLKVFLGIPSGDTSQDTVITIFKDATEQAVKNFCDTDFSTVVITNEIQDGVLADVIVPKNVPIISVQKVILGCKVDGTGGTQLDAASEFYFDDNAITLRYRDTPFTRGAVRIDYTWGYSSVPADVKLVVYQTVKAELKRKKDNTEAIGSRSKGDESESYGTGPSGGWDAATGLPKQMIAKLQLYKNYEFPLVNTAQRNW